MREHGPYISALPKGLLILFGLTLNTIAAVFGTAVLGVAVGFPIPMHTVPQIIVRSLLLAVGMGATVGFLVYRAWETVTAKWIWILPALLFGLRALGILMMAPRRSIMSDHGAFAELWIQMSGIACTGGMTLGCRNFFLFTNTLFRTVSYSVGAVVCEKHFRKQGIPSLRS
jgi:hypothetical protein